VIPDQATAFGERVHRRLAEEEVIWLTTVGRDGTPQPNPVWFVRDGDDGLLTYTLSTAKRLGHIQRQPHVSLHFNGTHTGGDVVVMTGTAEILDDYPSPADHTAYLDKYGDEMQRITGSVEAFAAEYPVPVRIRITQTRGF
jgi:PPOX class probable F420-dependent enzyme